MYVWGRLLKVLWQRVPKQSLDPLAESRIPLRVWFGDADVFGHMNNGRYLTLCDIGRFSLGARTGMNRVFRERRWHPVVASSAVRYRRSLKLFARFELSTRVVHWTGHWMFIEHEFLKDNTAYARVLVKAAVLGKEGKVPIAEVIKALGAELRVPTSEAAMLAAWQEFEGTFR